LQNEQISALSEHGTKLCGGLSGERSAGAGAGAGGLIIVDAALMNESRFAFPTLMQTCASINGLMGIPFPDSMMICPVVDMYLITA